MKKFWLSRASLWGVALAVAGQFLVMAVAQAVPAGHRLGPDAAPVYMEAWLDYATAENYQLQETYDKLLEQYGSRLQLIVKPFPVRGTEDAAYMAAEAGECVAAQGEDLFWYFHRYLIGKRGQWTVNDIWQWASSFQVYTVWQKSKQVPRFNYAVFSDCWKRRQMTDLISTYLAEGYWKEVESAPTTLVVSRTNVGLVARFEGLPSYESLWQTIDVFLNLRLPPSN